MHFSFLLDLTKLITINEIYRHVYIEVLLKTFFRCDLYLSCNCFIDAQTFALDIDPENIRVEIQTMISYYSAKARS